ncbi:AMP-binding protein [Thiohalobacter sp. IOR34]|uniref:AMP-binding protein n=1 Tax=Thiohalobacter sp. IOR34 TaxID=3057176 RepID=UPI0025B0CFF0|nr:AMP-binding protein [Thiohalobacter sp. IOR34]WJW74757.1 AMP-binding protein [Thiohalobacter sp. IOR34]
MDDTDRSQQLLELLDELVAELHQGHSPPPVSLDSDLERDLGIDSLARVELLLRLQQRLDASLPEHEALQAATPRALLRLLGGGAAPPTAEVAPPARGPIHARPEAACSLNEVLAFHAEHHAGHHYLTLYESGDEPLHLSYGELFGRTRQFAAALRERGLEAGDRVALMLPTSLAFFDAFYGTLLAGGVPAPLYPPASRARIEEFMLRQAGILDNAGARLLITTAEIEPFARLLKKQVAALDDVLTPDRLESDGEAAWLPGRGEDLAFLQYTSGSTGQPKGVMLSHANLLANIRAMGQAADVRVDDLFVSWLPLYHDMGLIGACLGTLYHGIPLVLMSPLAFISRPQRWLQRLHRHRGTLSAAPDFAYQLCASRLLDRELEGLDLSSWRLAFNGAEPVHAETLRRFSRRFAPYGFDPTAMTPVYGLAECAVGLAFPPLGRGPRIDRIQREAFMYEGRARPAADDDAEALELVSGGLPLPGHEIRIVDEQGRELGERQQGLLQFRGPSASAGYFRNPEASAALCDGDWRNAGDYAYLAAGEVFITGRAKDLIIRAGRNIYPYELEQAVGDLPGIRKGAVAVFATRSTAPGGERLVVLAETRERDPGQRQRLRARIEALALELIETRPDDIVLAPPRTVLKTSSGKIRRAACRDRYEQGLIGDHQQHPLHRLRTRTRLLARALAASGRRGGRHLAQRLYAGYAWGLLLVIGLATLLLVLLAPGLRAAQRCTHLAARLFLALAGIRLAISRDSEPPPDETLILVANHASYLDAIVLIAALDRPLHFVAKQELGRHRPLGWFLHRLGTEFVARDEVREALAATRRMIERVERGEAVLFFPEGTFTAASGLRPFRLGAFQVAAATGTAILPVALAGTRAVLRGENRLPRPGRVRVHVGRLLRPRGSDWAAVLDLRDRAREQILARCGEPDLAGRVGIARPAGPNG